MGVVIEAGPALSSPEAYRILFAAQGDQIGPAVMARETGRSSPPSGRVVVSLLALAGVLSAAIYASTGNSSSELPTCRHGCAPAQLKAPDSRPILQSGRGPRSAAVSQESGRG